MSPHRGGEIDKHDQPMQDLRDSIPQWHPIPANGEPNQAGVRPPEGGINSTLRGGATLPCEAYRAFSKSGFRRARDATFNPGMFEGLLEQSRVLDAEVAAAVGKCKEACNRNARLLQHDTYIKWRTSRAYNVLWLYGIRKILIPSHE